ncbi:MAG: hypothetical protein RIG61_04155 [Deltaproteobacteria bacterium]
MSVNNSEIAHELVYLGGNEGKAYTDAALPNGDDSLDNAGGEFIHSFISRTVIVVEI